MSLQYYDSSNDELVPIAGNVNPSDVLTLQTTKADKTQLSNPNLLDNPWFTVNQRGQNSYTADDGKAHYTVDRWAGIQINRKTIKPKANGGITVDYTGTASSTSWYALGQLIDVEPTANLKGKTVTMSMKVSNIQNMASVGFRILDWDSFSFVAGITEIARIAVTSDGLYSVTFTMPTTLQGDKVVVLVYGATDSTSYATAKFDVDAVKLELGSQSTLAMDAAPNYQQELAKCQRYFVRLFATYAVSQIDAGGTWWDGAYGLIEVPVNMRTKPSVSIGGKAYIVVILNASTIAYREINTMQIHRLVDNKLKYYCTLIDSSGITNGMLMHIELDSNAYIDLSADL